MSRLTMSYWMVRSPRLQCIRGRFQNIFVSPHSISFAYKCCCVHHSRHFRFVITNAGDALSVPSRFSSHSKSHSFRRCTRQIGTFIHSYYIGSTRNVQIGKHLISILQATAVFVFLLFIYNFGCWPKQLATDAVWWFQYTRTHTVPCVPTSGCCRFRMNIFHNSIIASKVIESNRLNEFSSLSLSHFLRMQARKEFSCVANSTSHIAREYQ